jgi:xylulokinase
VVGGVLPEAATEVGVAVGTPVVAGGGDGSCAAAGAGVLSEGLAYNYVGSSSWIALASRQPVWDPAYRTFTFGHVVPDMFMPTGTMQAAGASYQWARDQLCLPERHDAEALGISAYELMNAKASASPPGANGLLFLPYLMGERSPHWNPKARGAFIGLTIRHTREDMVRAVLEGVTLNLRVILDALTAQGVRIEAMRLIGGGARSRFWNQLMADVYGLPVQRMAVLEEATSMGAALTGGVGVGLYPDFSVAERMNRVVEVLEPSPEARLFYEATIPVFEAAYQALAPIFASLADAG